MKASGKAHQWNIIKDLKLYKNSSYLYNHIFSKSQQTSSTNLLLPIINTSNVYDKGQLLRVLFSLLYIK